MDTLFRSELTALQPLVQSTLTLAFAYRMVEDKLEANVNTSVIILSTVLEILMVMGAKLYVQVTIQQMERKVAITDTDTTLMDIIVTPFKLIHYILTQAVLILTQSFTVLIAFKIIEIQPAGELPIIVRVSFICGILSYFWTLLYGLNAEPNADLWRAGFTSGAGSKKEKHSDWTPYAPDADDTVSTKSE
jgi:hypothetical protein